MVIGLFPELLAPGGIQRVGRHVAAVLAAFAQERGVAYRFLSLNDPPGPHHLRVGSSDFAFLGFRRRKVRFGLMAAGVAGSRAGLVIAGHPHLAPVAWALKARSERLAVVVLSHGIEVWQPLSWVRRQALRRADLVLAPSSDTVRHLEMDQGVAPARLRRLPWGLDPQFSEFLEQPAECPLPAGFPSGRVILTVGRWSAKERYKGLDTLIAAMPRLLQEVPDAHLVAVGDGDDRPRLERLARELGLENRVRFLGSMTQAELSACYAHCSVFALPSRGEGFGLVFLEAMAHGKPVVGGAHGGAPEIIEEGVTGRLVSYGDVTRLSEILRELLMDEALCQRMGARARERILGEYSFDAFAARFREVLQSLCAF